MHKNQQGMLRADALGADMEGICRDEGRALFVPGLLPGEEGLVRIVKEQKRFAFGGLWLPPATPSPTGVIPTALPIPAAVVAPAGICVMPPPWSRSGGR